MLQMRQMRKRLLELQNIPIYDNSVVMYTKHIVEALPEPKVCHGEFKFYYTFTADVNGELSIPFSTRDEGHMFLLEVRARDYDVYKYNHTFMNTNMRMYLDMKVATSTDQDLLELEAVESNGVNWVQELEMNLIT